MKKRILFLLSFLFLFRAFSTSTPIPCLTEYTLDNGLQVFVAENHSVPLVYIEIAVKCGAFTQDKNNAGLFHLYEHMMFKGNSLYKTAASITRALSQMGVANWNGSTGLECVNYFFTVPSNEIENGLKFWNAAIRSPLLNKKEFEREKKVVLSEIEGNFSNPSYIVRNAKNNAMFSDAPEKMDPGGTVEVVKNSTVQKLKEIQQKYYVPNNAALFIGGDVKTIEVCHLVDAIFGDWEKGDDPFKNGIFRHSDEPFSEPRLLVFPHEKMATQIFQVEVAFRGPDAAFSEKDTYTADVLMHILSNPKSVFVQSLTQDKYLQIPGSDYVATSYPTQKQCGQFSFLAVMANPQNDAEKRSLYFMEQLPKILQKTVDSITDKDIQNVLQKIKDENIYANESAENLLQTLRFWWISTSEEYYYSYEKNISAVTKNDLQKFIEKYFIEKNPLVTVLVNPDVLKKTKSEWEKSGFSEVE